MEESNNKNWRFMKIKEIKVETGFTSLTLFGKTILIACIVFISVITYFIAKAFEL